MGDMDMDEQTFAEHTAEMIVSVAQAANEGDPQAIAEHALAMALDIGEDEPAGPDYPPELETADEAATELAEIEES